MRSSTVAAAAEEDWLLRGLIRDHFTQELSFFTPGGASVNSINKLNLLAIREVVWGIHV